MAVKTKRDYSLSGGNENAVALDDNDLIEERMTDTWWSPDIPRPELKRLMTRSDEKGLIDFGIWVVLLIVSGYIAVLSWGHWWAIPAFFVFGTIYSSSDARWHETGHGTVFKTSWLNEFWYQISSFMTFREAVMWRWSHARHHTDTIIVGRDPEIQVKRPADLLLIALDFFDIYSGPQEIKRIIQNAMGRPNADVLDFMPEEELPKLYLSSRIYLLIVAGFAVWSIAIGSFLPMMFVWLPRFYGGWLHQLLGLTQHAGLGEDTYDHRENTRTVYINPVFRYLYMNMNYHVEHHTIPMIPFHALPEIHEKHFKAQSPPAYKNLWEVYAEMIPVLIKQATEDPDAHITRPIPAPPEAAQPAVAIPASEAIPAGDETSEDAWVMACPIEELAENDVVGFEYNGNSYAVYRLEGDSYYASDGLCTHQKVQLDGGLVIDGCIECPKHNGRFDVTTGDAVRRPALKNLVMYPVEKREDGLYVFIPATAEETA